MNNANDGAAGKFEPVQFVPRNTQGKIRVPKMAELVADNIRSKILDGEPVSYTHLTLPTTPYV